MTSIDNNDNNNNNNDEIASIKDRDTALRVLGVCGGIGSGKSQACRLLVDKLGCRVHLEADSLAHRVYQPNNSGVVSEIAKAFPTVIEKQDDDDVGTINRKTLGSIVFADPKAMTKLEQIVWPHVKTIIQTEIETYSSSPPLQQENDREKVSKTNVLVLEAAVLIDAGWMDLLDGLWVVQASPEVALRRLTTYRGLDKDDALQRIQAQETRRGLGNGLQTEIDQGVVSAVIPNNEDDPDALQERLRQAMENPACWY